MSLSERDKEEIIKDWIKKVSQFPPLLHELTDRESWCYWKGYEDGKNKIYEDEQKINSIKKRKREKK